MPWDDFMHMHIHVCGLLLEDVKRCIVEYERVKENKQTSQDLWGYLKPRDMLGLYPEDSVVAVILVEVVIIIVVRVVVAILIVVIIGDADMGAVVVVVVVEVVVVAILIVEFIVLVVAVIALSSQNPTNGILST